MGLVEPEKPQVMAQFKNKISPDYDDTDAETLEKKYTPEQIEALTLGEMAVPSEDLVTQGRLRKDPYRLRYYEDFSTVRPVVDKRTPSGKPVDTSARFMTPDEFGDDFMEFVREQEEKDGVPADLVDIPQAYEMFEEMRSKMLSKEDGKDLATSDLADAMDRVLGPVEDIKSIEEALKKQSGGPGKGKEGAAKGTAEEYDPEKDQSMVSYKYIMERNAMTGFDGGDTALAPDLPEKVPGVEGYYKQEMDDEDANLDPEGKYQELKRQTGLSIKEIVDLFNKDTKIIVRRFVSNQTRLGKIRSAYVLAIAGNKNGRLGMGEAKSVDNDTANTKAKLAAIRNMQPIRRYENRTIYGNVEGKVGGTIVQLYARPPGTSVVGLFEIPISYSEPEKNANAQCHIGFGLRISHRFFEIARAAGIKDLAAKMPRSRNPMNSVKACFQALMNQPDPEQIAIGRGRKLVDARKVYYGGAVY